MSAEVVAAVAVTCAVSAAIGQALLRRERRKIAALGETERRFRSFMDNAPFSCLVIEGDRLVYANPIGLENRKRIGPLVGDKFYEGLPPAYNERVLAENSKVLSERKPSTQTRTLQDADGEMRHWHTVRFPIETGSGGVLLGMFAIDVTAVHRAIEGKEKAQQQLLESYKLAALGEMAGGIAHEVNNPVSIILGKSRQLNEILATVPVNLSEAREFADVITATCRRVIAIVNGLRTISRSSERDSCKMTPATTILEGTVAIVAARFRDADVELVVGHVAPDACFECRASEMIQVLTNLLSNALDAVAPLEDRWVRVDVHATATDLVMSVEDSGTGIPADLRARIMLPFFTTKEVGKGTGLGLSISRGLVAGHGGALTLDEGAEHTRFLVTMPLRQPPKVEAAG